MNVISLEHARSRLRAPRRIEPPAALRLPVPAHLHVRACDEIEDRLRMRQNVAAFAVIVVVIGLGSWLMSSLHHYSRLQACIEAGHRNCMPLDADYLPAPFSR